MDPRVQEILDNATDKQQDYVIARLTHPNTAQAARAIGITRSAPAHWDNLDELEEAVTILRREEVEAVKLALRARGLAAVAALDPVLKRGDSATVSAVRAILDRMGVPAQSAVDVTTKGRQLTPINFVEIVDPRDDE